MNARIWHGTNREYHAHPALSNSQLNVFCDSPQDYHAIYMTKTMPFKVSKEMLLGQQVHSLLLEPETVVEIPRQALSNSGSRAGRAWLQFKGEHPRASWLLKADELDEIRPIADAVKNCPLACEKLLEPEFIREQSIVWTDIETGLELRCRTDAIGWDGEGDFIADLKTTRNSKPEAFARAAYDHGYYRQVAFYREGVRNFTGLDLPFFFVAVQTSGTHAVEVIRLDEEFEAMGYQEFRDGLRRLARCREKAEWRSPTWNKVTTVKKPNWAKPPTEESGE